MIFYRVIKVGLGLSKDKEGRMVEQHIPIAAFEGSRDDALKYAEEFVENYSPAPKAALDTRVVYIDSVDTDEFMTEDNRDNIIEMLGLGEPIDEGRR